MFITLTVWQRLLRQCFVSMRARPIPGFHPLPDNNPCLIDSELAGQKHQIAGLDSLNQAKLLLP